MSEQVYTQVPMPEEVSRAMAALMQVDWILRWHGVSAEEARMIAGWVNSSANIAESEARAK